MADDRDTLQDINESFYDFRYEENEDQYIREKDGITEDLVLRISEEKREPDWMRELRLKCLKIL